MAPRKGEKRKGFTVTKAILLFTLSLFLLQGCSLLFHKPEPSPSKVKKSRKVVKKPPKKVQSKKQEKEKVATKNRRRKGLFIWPVDGVVTSKFGRRWGKMHDGIDIGTQKGKPIKAAAAGKVIFVGYMNGYGKVIILQHSKVFTTVYAHNSKNLVTEKERIRKGQNIALAGRTGRTNGGYVLHFEIRYKQKARDPLLYLPERKGIKVSKK